MVNWRADVVRVRTTSDGCGEVYGVVTGMATTPEDALAAMRREAERLAQQLGEDKDLSGRWTLEQIAGREPRDEPVVVRFEVVDARFTASTGGRWLAYGSLAWVSK